MAVAALFVCLCRMLYRLRLNNQSWRQYPVVLLQENRWRAQRYGVSGELIDFGRGALVPFANLGDEILELIAEDAAALNCTDIVARTRDIVRGGTSADRQVAVFESACAAGQTPRAALESVVDHLVGETAADT